MPATSPNILETVIYFAGIVITLTTALTIVVKYLKKQISGVAKEVTLETEKTLLKDIKMISDNLTEFKESYEKDKVDTEKILMTLAQDRVNQAHKHFMTINEIDPHSMFIIEQLYDTYKLRGGNGNMDRQMCDLRKLASETAARGKCV